MGIGTIIAEGVAGAVQGAGAGAAQEAEQEQQQQMLALRDQRLSDLATQRYKAQLQAQIDTAPSLIAAQTPGLIDRARQEAQVKADAERQAPYTLSPGSTRVIPGTQPATSGYDDQGDALDTSGNVIGPNAGTPTQEITAPTKLSPGQEAYYSAHAAEAQALTARYQAEADAINAGQRYNAQNQRPKVTLLDKDQGLLKDENTGAVGYVVPGKPATPGKTHVLGPDEPGKPATLPSVVWFDASGKALPNGLADLYPNRRPGRGTPSQPNADAPASAPAADTGGASSTPAPDSASTPNAPETPQATATRAKSLGGYNGDKPPAKYPDAMRAPDGYWYVRRAGQLQLITSGN